MHCRSAWGCVINSEVQAVGSSAGPGVRKGKVSHTLAKEGRRCQSSEESASESRSIWETG